MSLGGIVLLISVLSLVLLAAGVILACRQYDSARSSFVDFKHKCGQ